MSNATKRIPTVHEAYEKLVNRAKWQDPSDIDQPVQDWPEMRDLIVALKDLYRAAKGR